LEKDENEVRGRELENIVGNLMIAEYQVTKLRDRLIDRIGVLVGFSGGSINLISSHNSSGILLTVGRYLTLS
jgi:hypothetical protein